MDMNNLFHQKYKNIYVICASYYKTGGTEVLHQLVYHLNELGGCAYIAYINLIEGMPLCNPVFEGYVNGHIITASEIEDSPENAIIIPEGYPEYNEKYSRAVKLLWWLSVDNFEGIYNFDDNEIDKIHESFKNTISLHLVQSKYSEVYLRGKGVPASKIRHLADYINQIYMQDLQKDPFKEDIILYNPKKGAKSTESIMEAGADLNFVPLKDLTNEQIRELMGKAKVYIDFGNHPGKDRIPREAAMCGCIVITGRHGSAAFKEDICIPDLYKLDENEVSAKEVVNVIRKCLSEYDERKHDFDEYRNIISNEKHEFIEDIKRIFFDFKAEASVYDGLSPNKTLIVIVSYNSCHLMQENIKSIRETLPSGVYKIAVVDNASTDGVAEWLSEQEDILFIKNEENVGFGPACNQAVRATVGTEYENYDVFLLNNDTRLAPNSLFFLKKALYSGEGEGCRNLHSPADADNSTQYLGTLVGEGNDQESTELSAGKENNLRPKSWPGEIGAVGSVSNYAGNNQELAVEFDRVSDYLAFGKELNLPCEDPYEERVRLSGFAMLIKRKAWDEAGGFDEDFAPGYFEDDALSMELSKRGYHILLVKNSFVYHAGSQSFAKLKEEPQSERNTDNPQNNPQSVSEIENPQADSEINDIQEDSASPLKRPVKSYKDLLIDHQKLFIEKYGFDIIEYAYADDAVIAQLPFSRKDSFRLLQIGSGLGADLKAARSLFPYCEPVGYEPEKMLYEIAKNTEDVYNSLKELARAFPAHYFDALIIDPKLIEKMNEEYKRLIVGLCRETAPLFSKNVVYENFPYEKIKLIVWDMDDTFWQGIISEGEVLLSSLNVELIKSLTDHGIVNSISSKNDEEPVCRELTEAGIWEYFVFNQINWDEKGEQLAAKLKAMGLRAENTLFIDDNLRNLEQAKMSSPELMTAGPEIIPYLYTYYSKQAAKDTAHDRLNQYKLLEKKTEAEVGSTSKEQFLFDSDIRVSVNRNCLEELDRIHELVSRTNQLNYTKNRDNKELLTRLITNDWNDCAYIRVRDRFGDYGITGFYCYNRREKKLEHFLFSCRVLGMGIEQYAYNLLGCPDFSVKGKVASELSKGKETPWIKEDQGAEISEDRLRNNRVRVLLKGPCDMSAIEPYLAGGNITTEFNYINEQGFATTGQNHTMHIYESEELSKEEIDAIVSEVPFIIEGDFETKLFTEEYHVICLSLLQDLSAGLYENKETGEYISFSSRNFDLTSPEFKDRFISGEIQGHEFPFTEEIIDSFSEKWEFVGATPFELLLRNLDYIYDNVKGEPIIILLLGSEIDYEGNNEGSAGRPFKKGAEEEFAGLCDVYREINPVIKAFAEDHERMRVIDPTEYIHSQADFEDCINHFSRNVYYEIAGRICDYINEAVDRMIKK